MERKPARGPLSPIPKVGWPLFLIIGTIIVFVVARYIPSSEEISWRYFQVNILPKKAVERIIVVNRQSVRVYIRKEFANDSLFREQLKSPLSKEGYNPGPHYTFTIGSVEAFERAMEEAQKDIPPNERIDVRYEESSHIVSLLGWLLPMVVLFFLVRLMMRNPGWHGGHFNV